MCIVGNSPHLRHPAGPTVINTPWTHGPFSSPGSTVVVHQVNMCAFIVPHMHLRIVSDNNVNAGNLILMQSTSLMMGLPKVTWVAHLCRWVCTPTLPPFSYNKILWIDFMIYMCSCTCIFMLWKTYICVCLLHVYFTFIDKAIRTSAY